ncbi:hypothetical protein PROPHIGD91-3_14 [Mycobacterium phage prophi91-3]|uniref:hypothetical protein n=1 Tax=Mycobacteroides abscessus TaxID=36809 RepID=UPI0019D0F825|nr:hypothetical protein [Mycobacteroides abscessus]QSM88771.1 hypothetical protein I3U44_24040 [Mycobacteroides abscessus subsp. bolletii]QST90017.1 hypothetical protein PROPHIGD91-3_14 [Mycobacterium phage prophi91-3]
MTIQPVIDHRGDSAPAPVVDDYPLGECPPVTWWQVQNIPYAVIISEAVDIAIHAALDLIAVTLFGKTWAELVDQMGWQPMPTRRWFA